MPAPALLTQLQEILANARLGERASRNGERLLQRLSSPVRIAVLGPDGDTKDAFCEMLQARPVPDTTISSLAHTGDVPVGQADICLWCTSEFDEAEIRQWQQAPDRLKDHSFLVPLAVPDTAQVLFAEDRLDALGNIAAEEFHSMFPVLIARAGSTRPSTFETLVDEIDRLVRSGRAVDRDNAQFFVQRYQTDATPPSGSGEADIAENDRNAPAPVETPPDATGQPADDVAVETYQKAYSHICERAADLADLASSEDEDGITMILSFCQETSETVAEVFSASHSDDPDFVLLKEDVLCAADKLLLMSLEDGVTPAIAAVGTLLQTRRDMEMRMTS